MGCSKSSTKQVCDPSLESASTKCSAWDSEGFAPNKCGGTTSPSTADSCTLAAETPTVLCSDTGETQLSPRSFATNSQSSPYSGLRIAAACVTDTSVPGCLDDVPRSTGPRDAAQVHETSTTSVDSSKLAPCPRQALAKEESEMTPRTAAAVDQAQAALALLGNDEDDLDDEEDASEHGEGFETFRQKAPREIHADSQASPFPSHVEVTLATRKLLLTWTRWARNSLRIKQEEHLKALQHVRYPKYPFRAKTTLSPQPTPRSGAAATQGATQPEPAVAFPAARSPAKDPVSPGLARSAARWEPRVPSRASRPDHGTGLFDEMQQEQRESMEAQGMKHKLCRKLGSDAAVSKSSGTPGFGVETPNPWGVGSSRASAAASVASSGVCSPANQAATGQLSPWILEAEALVSTEDYEEDLLTSFSRPASSAAWGASPSSLDSLEKQLFGPSGATTVGDFGKEDKEPLETIPDEDELDQVHAELFVRRPEAPAVRGIESQACVAHEAMLDQMSLASGGVSGSGQGERNDDVGATVGVSNNLARVSSAGVMEEGLGASSSSGKAVEENATESKYKPGEVVRYWSATKRIWMPARIVERKSEGVYLIDKQMRGCFAKVRVSELISETEEQANPVLRAVLALGGDSEAEDSEPQEHRSRRRRKRKSAEAVPVGRGSVSASAKSYTEKAKRPSTPPHLRGCVVRTDFSSDSDQEAPPADARRGAQGGGGSTPSGRGAAARQAAPLAKPLTAGRGGTLPSTIPPTRPTTPPHLRGRIARDDFSDDSDDG